MDLFENSIIDLPPGGRLSYHPDWIEAVRADQLFERLSTDLPWKQRPIRLFGKEVMQPRLTSFHGDSGVSYRYSGKTLDAQPWSAELAELRRKLVDQLDCEFNSVLCNLYRDGRDSMGWHADDEKELGTNPVIASVSLGQSRRFRLKPRGEGEALSLDLVHGSLLVMAGDVQHHWLHELPKSSRPMGPRINLTFRSIA
ncbi:MAG: alpha-ketoglutarate-dependent dioxygenase AlkB [Pseudomonadota bacterium]